MSTLKKKITGIFLQFIIDISLRKDYTSQGFIIPFNRSYVSGILDNELFQFRNNSIFWLMQLIIL